MACLALNKLRANLIPVSGVRLAVGACYDFGRGWQHDDMQATESQRRLSPRNDLISAELNAQGFFLKTEFHSPISTMT